MQHRGPDDAGAFVEASSGVAFGFRRLAILDLTPLGHQPMQSPSGRITIVFNGEIYNHRELRQELIQQGVTFRGRSDTEVLCAAIECWGTRTTFERAAGMFAVAAWDREARQLTLARDRMGIKPLHVYSEPGFLSFGSELKVLAAGPRFSRRLSARALTQYQQLLYVPGPETIFERTIKLEPGSILTIADPQQPLPAPVKYWSVETAARAGRLGGNTVDAGAVDSLVERALEQSVADHLESDVPLGGFLSGGIDSSAVVALMQRASGRPVRTFTIKFDDPAHDESAHAEAVARHLGTDHTTIPVAGSDALAEIPRLADVYDEPFADASQLPSLLVSAAARRHVSVVLTGDGGDEVFGGYNRYRYGIQAFPLLRRIPRPLRRALAVLTDGSPTGSIDRGYDLLSRHVPGIPRERLIGEKVHKLGRLLRADDDATRYFRLLGTTAADSRTSSLPDGLADAFDERHGHASLLDRMLLADQVSYLPDNQMTKVDRASMAHSLEARVPLLDHRVVELSWQLPAAALIDGGSTKAALRRVLYRMVPKELLERPKTGFSVPIASWLRGPLREWGEASFSSASLSGSPLDATDAQATWRTLMKGNDSVALSVWSLLVFESWRARWL